MEYSIVPYDAAGNQGGALTSNATSPLGSVVFDKTAPSSFSGFTISSNNSVSTLAKVGDVVTVRFTSATTVVAVPTLTVGGSGTTGVSPS